MSQELLLPIESSEPSEPSLPHWICLLILVLATFGVYSSSFNGNFLFDDSSAILKNDGIRKITPARVEYWLTHKRGLPYFTFAINYAISGDDYPHPYHLFNWLVHLAASMALYYLAYLILVGEKWKGRYEPFASQLALTIALLWALHPLNTQAVTYIVQRFESLMGMFGILSMLCFVLGARARSWGGRIGYFLLCYLCLYLSAISKEVAVVLPLLIFWLDRALVAVSWRELLRRRWFFYAPLLCGICLGTYYVHQMLFKPEKLQSLVGSGYFHNSNFAMVDPGFYAPTKLSGYRDPETLNQRDIFGVREGGRKMSRPGMIKPNPPKKIEYPKEVKIGHLTSMEYFWNQSQVYTRYFYLMVFPDSQCLDQFIQKVPSAMVKDANVTGGERASYLPSPPLYPYIVFVGVVLLATGVLFFWKPWAGFLAGAFFLALAPTSSIMPIRDMFFEHRLYLPLVFPAALLVIAGWESLQFLGRRLPGRLQFGVEIAVVSSSLMVFSLSCGAIAWRLLNWFSVRPFRREVTDLFVGAEEHSPPLGIFDIQLSGTGIFLWWPACLISAVIGASLYYYFRLRLQADHAPAGAGDLLVVGAKSGEPGCLPPLPPEKVTKLLLPVVLAIVLITALGTTTFCRNFVYHDALGMWLDITRKSPDNDRAWSNTAIEFFHRKDYVDPDERYKQTLRYAKEAFEREKTRAIIEDRRVKRAAALINVATSSIQLGSSEKIKNVDEAKSKELIREGKIALEIAFVISPRTDDVKIAIAWAFQVEGDYDNAEAWYYPIFHNGRGTLTPIYYRSTLSRVAKNYTTVLLFRKKYTTALPILQGWYKRKPNNVDAGTRLYKAYRHLGREKEAKELLTKIRKTHEGKTTLAKVNSEVKVIDNEFLDDKLNKYLIND